MQFTTLFFIVATLAGTAMPMPTHLSTEPHRTVKQRMPQKAGGGAGGAGGASGAGGAAGPQGTPMPAQGGSVIDAAKSQMGQKYVWGGGGCQGPSKGGFDCSGLTQYAMCKSAGITIPRTAQTQYSSSMGQHVPRAQAQPGDLIFWGSGGNCKSGVKHVGIFAGPGQMINAPHTGTVVRQQAIWTSSGGESICPDAVRFTKGGQQGGGGGGGGGQ